VVRRSCVLAAVLAAAVLVVASAALAEEVTVRGAVSGEYLYNLEEDASAFDGRVEFDAEAGRLLLGAVYRAYQLSNPYYNPALKDIPASEVKHRYAEFRGDDFSVRAGHFFSTFGKGLTLRSYEEVDLEHDTVLDGLVATYEGAFGRVTALSGVADEELTPSRTRGHVIRGVEAAISPWDWATLGGSVVERSWEDKDEDVALPDSLALFEDVVLGGQGEFWLGPVTVSAEYAGRSGENPATGREAVQGHGTYVSGTLDLGWATVFGEFKDYDDFAHRMVNPPTCVREHLWTLMNRATYEINLDDERGFLAEGAVPLGDRLSITGGASEARHHDGELAHWEMFGELSHSLGESITGTVAASRSREYLLGKFTEHVIGAADVDVDLESGLSFGIALEAGRTDDVTGFDYEDYLASVTWYPGGGVTVSHVFESTTSPLEARDTWFVSEVKKRVSEDLEIAIAAGSERGGKKCAGGVCYFEPEFAGVRLRLNSYF
jgi:hypothetical protein